MTDKGWSTGGNGISLQVIGCKGGGIGSVVMGTGCTWTRWGVPVICPTFSGRCGIPCGSPSIPGWTDTMTGIWLIPGTTGGWWGATLLTGIICGCTATWQVGTDVPGGGIIVKLSGICWGDTAGMKLPIIGIACWPGWVPTCCPETICWAWFIWLLPNVIGCCDCCTETGTAISFAGPVWGEVILARGGTNAVVVGCGITGDIGVCMPGEANGWDTATCPTKHNVTISSLELFSAYKDSMKLCTMVGLFYRL